MSFQLHGEYTVLQPFRRIELIVHIVIPVLPGTTHFHPSQVKQLRVKCLAQGYNIGHNNETKSPRLRGGKHDISLKIPHQAGRETARQAATETKRHALTIAPRPSLKPYTTRWPQTTMSKTNQYSFSGHLM